MDDRYAEAYDIAFGLMRGLAPNERKQRAASIAKRVTAIGEGDRSAFDSLQEALAAELGARGAKAVVAPALPIVEESVPDVLPGMGEMEVAILTGAGRIKEAEELHQALTRLGYRPWLYSKSIRLGRRIRAEDDAALVRSSYVIVLVSREALASNFVDYELDLVHWLEMAERRERLLPVVVDGLPYEEMPVVMRPLRAIRWGRGGVGDVAQEIKARIDEDAVRRHPPRLKSNRTPVR